MIKSILIISMERTTGNTMADLKLTPESPNASVGERATSSTAPSRSRRLIVIGFIGVTITVCACIGIAGFFAVQGIQGINREQLVIAPIVDNFMQAMLVRDTNRAYQLFSTRAQRQTAIADLDALITGPNYVLFDGYQSLTIGSTNISTIANTDPNVPQGIVANVSGTITYAGGIEGTFRATLEKEEGGWRLDAINVTVPPSKTLP